MVYVFLAKGFEELEALAPVDVLRRANIEVKTVGVTGKIVSGSHGIAVNCDITISEATFDNLDGIILPGGMPGTLNLEADEHVNKFINYAWENGKFIGAICAAPSILGKLGILQGKNAVCFPGFEDELKGSVISEDFVVTDGLVVTGKGMGATIPCALQLLELFKDSETANNVHSSLQCPY